MVPSEDGATEAFPDGAGRVLGGADLYSRDLSHGHFPPFPSRRRPLAGSPSCAGPLCPACGRDLAVCFESVGVDGGLPASQGPARQAGPLGHHACIVFAAEFSVSNGLVTLRRCVIFFGRLWQAAGRIRTFSARGLGHVKVYLVYWPISRMSVFTWLIGRSLPLQAASNEQPSIKENERQLAQKTESPEIKTVDDLRALEKRFEAVVAKAKPACVVVEKPTVSASGVIVSAAAVRGRVRRVRPRGRRRQPEPVAAATDRGAGTASRAASASPGGNLNAVQDGWPGRHGDAGSRRSPR